MRSKKSEVKSEKWGSLFPNSAFRIPNLKLWLLGLAMLTLGSLGATPGGLAPPLLWPLAIREGITSSFGEYRRTHFHGGVDMRTHQEEGWACVAPADGKVARLRREPGGYGRVLYLDLDDGRTIVYGHVCRFENGKLHLDDALYRACERAGTSFPGDITLDPPVRVKAGDTVCYSGELGIGTPHLHFEVRRGDEQLDPFVEGLPLPDGVETPRIAGITFEPQDATGTVDGGFAPVFVPATRTSQGYRLGRTVTVGGAVDLFLSAGDHLGVPGNTTGVPIIVASLDGAVFSRMDLKRISLAHFKESPALFDPDYDRPGTNTYRLEASSRGSQWTTSAATGCREHLGPGKHQLEVTVSNRAGHSALLRRHPRGREGRGRGAPGPAWHRVQDPGARDHPRRSRADPVPILPGGRHARQHGRPSHTRSARGGERPRSPPSSPAKRFLPPVAPWSWAMWRLPFLWPRAREP